MLCSFGFLHCFNNVNIPKFGAFSMGQFSTTIMHEEKSYLCLTSILETNAFFLANIQS